MRTDHLTQMAKRHYQLTVSREREAIGRQKKPKDQEEKQDGCYLLEVIVKSTGLNASERSSEKRTRKFPWHSQ